MLDRNKRILYEIKKNLSNCNENFITYHDENNINNSISLIFGNQNTPYNFGFFFIHSIYPEKYPFEPIICKFIPKSKFRIHPNINSNGKICLSILGTSYNHSHNGSKWTPCYNLFNVIVSIQSIFCDYNEKYNEIIQYIIILHYCIQQYKDILTNHLYIKFKNHIHNFINNNVNDITEYIIHKYKYNKCNLSINLNNPLSIKYDSQYINIDYEYLLKEWFNFINTYSFFSNINPNIQMILTNIIHKNNTNQSLEDKVENIEVIIPEDKVENIEVIIPEDKLENIEVIIPEDKLENIEVIIPEDKVENIEVVIPEDKVENVEVVIPEDKLENIEVIIPEQRLGENVEVIIPEQRLGENVEVIIPEQRLGENVEVIIDTIQENNIVNKKKKMGQPSLLAKNYDEGFEMKSDVDGRIYVIHIYNRSVFVSGIKKSYQVKRWILKKD